MFETSSSGMRMRSEICVTKIQLQLAKVVFLNAHLGNEPTRDLLPFNRLYGKLKFTVFSYSIL